ncbi:MAG: DUF4105 domain-containing protein [Bacteriovoracaceae bacterium]
MKKYWFFIIFICLRVYAIDPMEKAEKVKLWHHPQWINLLHYKDAIFSGHKSEADSQSFFLTPNGKHDPKEELLNFVKQLKVEPSKKDPDNHITCRFPARFEFIKTQLQWAPHYTINCPKFNEFQKKLSAKSIALVFSSYYLDTPASAFGHTLLRFSKFKDPNSKKAKENELLDYAVNYAATVTTSNALLYGVMGIIGGFKGEFATMPYFYKIREYNDYESRDLWSYHLNLNQKQIDFLVSHVWEMSNTWYWYYYFTENCSYHLLGLLDAVNPEWKLTERIPYIVVPVDTLKIAYETKNFVKGVSFRPSKKRVLTQRLKHLSSEQKEFFSKTIHNFDPAPLSDLPNQSKSKVLDTLMDYIDYKSAEEVLKEESEASKKKRKVLISRAKTGVKSSPINVTLPKSESPHLGHDSRRVSLYFGKSSSSDFFSSLEYRFALHDLMDPVQGHNPKSTMEMGNIRLRFNQKVDYLNNSSSLRVEHFSLIDVVSLNHLERFLSNLSWRFYLGAKTIRDNGCVDCFAPSIEGGGGYSQRINNLYYSFFLTTLVQPHKELGHRGVRIGAGPELSLYWQPSDRINIKAFGEFYYYVLVNNHSSYRYGLETRWEFIKNMALNINITRFETGPEGSLGLLYYF